MVFSTGADRCRALADIAREKEHEVILLSFSFESNVKCIFKKKQDFSIIRAGLCISYPRFRHVRIVASIMYSIPLAVRYSLEIEATL